MQFLKGVDLRVRSPSHYTLGLGWMLVGSALLALLTAEGSLLSIYLALIYCLGLSCPML